MSLPVGYLQALLILKASKYNKNSDNYLIYLKNLGDKLLMSKFFLFAK